MATATPSEVRVKFYGDVATFMADETRYIDLEGAFRSGKTTAALWKVFKSCRDHPGIHWLLCRYGDGDTQSKLKPAWRAICDQAQVTPVWDPHASCDTLPNGSKAYLFGLKAQDQVTRYAKLRGLTVAGIYNDQSEELPKDVFQEFMGRLSQPGFPHQLILTPNPPDENHWLAREFPEDNHLRDRKYYSVPIYANAQNLSPDTIAGLEAAYPVSHPKHRSAVLGKRGLNVIGEPVYSGAFIRAAHERPLTFNPQLPLYEALDFGKHHPCVVWAQFSPFGGLLVLGGVLGHNLYLPDFVPVLLRYRQEWFPEPLEVLTTCDPAGSHNNSQGIDVNGVSVLRDLGIYPRWEDHANAPTTRYACIERLASYMRRRDATGQEAFGVDGQRWLRVGVDGAQPWTFLADGLQSGYVWDEHLVSVGSKQVRRPRKDGWYEHGQNCLEYLELAFGQGHRSQVEMDRQMAALSRAALKRAQQDADPLDRWRTPSAGGARRGGY